jgi:hypothetical protein
VRETSPCLTEWVKALSKDIKQSLEEYSIRKSLTIRSSLWARIASKTRARSASMCRTEKLLRWQLSSGGHATARTPNNSNKKIRLRRKKIPIISNNDS